MARGIDFVFTDEMKKFIECNQYGISRKELLNRFNKEFGTDYTINAIKGYVQRNGLKNGFDGCFLKGQAPLNKGVPMDRTVYEKCAGTMFKKGNIPVNHRPVGSERVNVDGYIEVKIAEPRKWRAKHNVVWESVNGAIPKNHVVISLDGNKLNTDIENLKLISRKELLIMNRHGLFQNNRELTETAATLAKLISESQSAKKRI